LVKPVGVAQEEIAEAAGVPQPTVAGWINDFIETSAAEESIMWHNFEPPIYNFWKQQADFLSCKAIHHGGHPTPRTTPPESRNNEKGIREWPRSARQVQEGDG